MTKRVLRTVLASILVFLCLMPAPRAFAEATREAYAQESVQGHAQDETPALNDELGLEEEGAAEGQEEGQEAGDDIGGDSSQTDDPDEGDAGGIGSEEDDAEIPGTETSDSEDSDAEAPGTEGDVTEGDATEDPSQITPGMESDSDSTLDPDSAISAIEPKAKAKTKTETKAKAKLLPVKPGNVWIKNGVYSIATRLNRGLLLDVKEAGTKNGTDVQLYRANRTLAQMFQIRHAPGGFYTIRALHSAAALAVAGNSRKVGARVYQYKYNGTISQLWAINKNANGSYTFTSKRSGLVLDLVGGRARQGTLLRQTRPGNTASQSFVLKKPVANILPPNVFSARYVAITPKGTTQRVTVHGASLAHGRAVVLSKANETAINQVFRVELVKPGVYAFKAAHSGRYLTAGASRVTQASGLKRSANRNQQWRILPAFGGYSFTNVGTGEVLGRDSLKGRFVLRMTASAAAASSSSWAMPTSRQIFKVVNVPVIMPNGTFAVRNQFGLRIDKAGGATSNGTAVQVYKANSTDAQIWGFTRKGSYYVVACARSGRVLDITGGSKKNGARLQLWDYNGTSAQLWRLVPSGDGWFYLRSKSGMYLATSNGKKNGSRLVTAKTLTSKAQKFRFTKKKYKGLQGTYADVNLSTQRMIFVKDGRVVVDCDVVTGAPGMDTPTGTFRIIGKQSPSVLVGADYAAPVSFWMPFTYAGHGFHDATWQSSFGGDRWRTGYGSHGCVNMPFSSARDLYRWISVGDSVRIHW